MRGSDYVAKRLFYAVITVFVAITLNFVLFRALSGDAVSALRCRQCSTAFKVAQRRDLGLWSDGYFGADRGDGRLGPHGGIEDQRFRHGLLGQD